MHRLLFSLTNKRVKFKISILVNFVDDLMSFYAVAKGRSPGIYMTWDECKAQVHKFPGPVYKKFKTKDEANNFISQHTSGASSSYPKMTVTKSTSLFAGQKHYALGQKNGSLTSNSSKRMITIPASDSDSDAEIKPSKKKFKPSDSTKGDLFTVDENGYTEVYTDGACTSNGRGNAKAGIGIWFSDNNPHNISQPVIGRATNNMAEIQAVTVAAKQAQKIGIKKLKISTDSKFLISCITQWMPKWKRNGWQTATGKPVINKEELIEMEKALAPLQITWNHVRGHVGIHGNEMADKLAREGAVQYEK